MVNKIEQKLGSGVAGDVLLTFIVVFVVVGVGTCGETTEGNTTVRHCCTTARMRLLDLLGSSELAAQLCRCGVSCVCCT